MFGILYLGGKGGGIYPEFIDCDEAGVSKAGGDGSCAVWLSVS